MIVRDHFGDHWPFFRVANVLIYRYMSMTCPCGGIGRRA
jgi:hypothetical protein